MSSVTDYSAEEDRQEILWDIECLARKKVETLRNRFTVHSNNGGRVWRNYILLRVNLINPEEKCDRWSLFATADGRVHIQRTRKRFDRLTVKSARGYALDQLLKDLKKA